MGFDSKVLVRNDNLVARWVPAGQGNTLAVTFDSYSDRSDLDREGFGQRFFTQRGIDAVHVISASNDWYQYAETGAALDAIRAVAGDYERVVAYGSSMGGYAAVKMGARAGAHGVLALAPQYSLDPSKVPFEPRWAADARRIRFRAELDDAFTPAAKTVVVYDPRFELDSLHADLIAREAPIEPLHVRYGGHQVTLYLSEAGLLGPLLSDFLEDRLDVADFARRSRAVRKTMTVYYSELSTHTALRRGTLSMDLARRGAEVRPDSAAAMHFLAAKLAAAGELDESIEIHEKIFALGDYPGYIFAFFDALMLAGRHDRAMEVAHWLIDQDRTTARSHHALSRVHVAAGRSAAGFDALREAVRLDPENEDYRRELIALLRKVGWRRPWPLLRSVLARWRRAAVSRWAGRP